MVSQRPAYLLVFGVLNYAFGSLLLVLVGNAFFQMVQSHGTAGLHTDGRVFVETLAQEFPNYAFVFFAINALLLAAVTGLIVSGSGIMEMPRRYRITAIISGVPVVALATFAIVVLPSLTIVFPSSYAFVFFAIKAPRLAIVVGLFVVGIGIAEMRRRFRTLALVCSAVIVVLAIADFWYSLVFVAAVSRAAEATQMGLSQTILPSVTTTELFIRLLLIGSYPLVQVIVMLLPRTAAAFRRPQTENGSAGKLPVSKITAPQINGERRGLSPPDSRRGLHEGRPAARLFWGL